MYVCVVDIYTFRKLWKALLSSNVKFTEEEQVHLQSKHTQVNGKDLHQCSVAKNG